MGFYLAIVFVSVAIASASSLEIENNDPICPPTEQIHPCRCSKISGWVTAICKDIKNQREISDVFATNPDWKLEAAQFEQSTFDYVPASIMEVPTFRILRVINSTLVSFLDPAPVESPAIIVNLTNVKILRGIQWEFFSNINLISLEVDQTDIPIIGDTFKEHVPASLKVLWLSNTKLMKIKDQSFQRLVNLDSLVLVGGSLKKVSRDMFPRPWNVRYLNLAKQKLAELPKDFFTELPHLEYFNVEGNYFTSISEKVFTKRRIFYILKDNPIECNCQVKWITTSIKDYRTRFLGTCAEPESLKGKDLQALQEKDFPHCP